MASSSNSEGPKVGEFVPVKLTQFNYSIWKPMMMGFLRNRGMVGFIDGTPPPPEKMPDPNPNLNPDVNNISTNEIENQGYKDWKNSDEQVRIWILMTLHPNILASVANLKTARQMWTMIESGLSHPFNDQVVIMINEQVKGQNQSRYLPLYNAAIKGDWITAENIFQHDPNAVSTIITGASETVLHVAVRLAKRNHFVEKLVGKMSPKPENLAIQDCFGNTALHAAAVTDNIEAARWMVKENPELPGIPDKSVSLPLHAAASRGRKKMTKYLMEVTKPDMAIKPFEGFSGLKLVHALIHGGLFDIALSVVRQYPELAQADMSPLRTITLKQSAFKSGTEFNFCQRLVYSCVPMELESLENNRSRGAIQNRANCISSVKQKLKAIFWKKVTKLVPPIKRIQEKKLLHHQALKLVKYLCLEIAKLDFEKANSIFAEPLGMAAAIGNHEVVEEILASFPSALYLRTGMQQNLFHIAIVNRRVNVFNLVYQFQELSHTCISAVDALMNNGLHLIGYLQSQHLVGSPETEQKLNLRSSAAGAALQMQRELQWFKEVEKLGLPQDREQRNTTGKTAKMIFIETHEELAKEGERWMKDRAQSCTIIATLVITTLFAAAIALPGGHNGSGLPIFSEEFAFKVFAVADVLALFSSASSVLMFLGILTSRYALEDFLFSLPNRFIIGLVTLFLSITFLMIAFSATVYLVFAHKKEWVLISVSTLAFIPVTLFAFLQFPPIWDMIKSTYFSGIFGRKSDRVLI